MRLFKRRSPLFAGMIALLWACGGCTLDTGEESEEVESVQEALGYNWQSGMGSDFPATFLGGDPVCTARMFWPLDQTEGWFIGRTRLLGCLIAYGNNAYLRPSYRTLHGGPLAIADSVVEPPSQVRAPDGVRALCIGNSSLEGVRGQPGYVIGTGSGRRCRIADLNSGTTTTASFSYITYSVI